jgi:putative drug exporter of the RND superfamily
MLWMMILRRLVTVSAGRRSKWLILVVWLALFAGSGALASGLDKVEENDLVNYLPASAESTKVAKLLDDFPAKNTTEAVVVSVRPSGLTEADRTAVEDQRRSLAQFAHGPIPAAEPSADGKALLLRVLLGSTTPADVADDVDGIRATVAEGAPPGLDTKVTGPAGGTADIIEADAGSDATLVVGTIILVAVVLLVTYRSPILWLVPLISVFVASQFASGVVYLLAKYGGLTFTGLSRAVLTVLTFGVGTDYALLLIARYREELRRQPDRHTAMAHALRRSGPAILASAGTVSLGLLCLLVADMNSTHSLGPVSAVGVVAAFIVVMTLLPALLVILGRWTFWPFIPRFREDAPVDARAEHRAWSRLAGLVGRRPVPIALLSAVVLGLLWLGVPLAKVGLSQAEIFRTTPESVVGAEQLAQHYPAGSSRPTQVVANRSAEQQVTQAIRDVGGVAEVLPSVQSGTHVMMPTVLSDPWDSRQAEDTVERLRARVHQVPGANALVGGQTATTLDTREATASDQWIVLPLVIVVVLLILMALLRAVVLPVILMLTVVASFGAAYGGSVLLYRALGWQRIDYTLLLYAFIFLVALGVDYNIFLMTRAREETIAHGHREGLLRALAVTGGVITSAGIALAATFSLLTLMPLRQVVQLGIIIAGGVLLDALLVRALLVPALTLIVGPRTWWPSSLGRQREVEPTTRAYQPTG